MAKPGLRTHRKFLRLVAFLKGEEDRALGLLEGIWLSCADATSDTFTNAAELEAAARWKGTKGQLVKLLKECGFLDRLKGSKQRVHDYWDHAPEYVKKRRHRAEEEAADNGRHRRTPDAENRPLRSRSRSASLPGKTSPRSKTPRRPGNGNRLSTPNEGEGETAKTPITAPGSVGETLLTHFRGYTGPPEGYTPPRPTKPIGAYDLHDCIDACARYDDRKPFHEAQRMWGQRIGRMVIYPTGLAEIRDLLASIHNGNIPGNPKGVGKVNTPAAYLNAKTAEYLAARKKENESCSQ